MTAETAPSMVRGKVLSSIDRWLLPAPSFAAPEELVNDWLKMLHAAGRSPATVKASALACREWLAFARGQGMPVDPTATTGEHLREWLGQLRDRHLKQNTIASWSNRVRAWFRYLDDQGEIQGDPWKRIPRIKREEPPTQPPSPGQMEALLAPLRERARIEKSWMAYRDVAALAVLFDTGLRAQEFLALRVGDLARDEITVIGKGRRARVIGLSANVQAAVRRYVRAYERAVGPLAPEDQLWRGNRVALGYGGLWGIVSAAAKAGGVALRPHLLRHGFATWFLEEGGDRYALQVLLGHSTDAMTKRYISSREGHRALREHQARSPARNLKLT